MSEAALGLADALPAGLQRSAAPLPVCAHCGEPAPWGRRFCCAGCEAAHAAIEGMGLGRYYELRVLDPAAPAPRPSAAEDRDLLRHVVSTPDGRHALTLAVEGLQCGACVWLIELVLARQPGQPAARLNMTTRRLRLTWRGEAGQVDGFVASVERLGYRLVPFEAALLSQAGDATGRGLMRALAVAGFAAANVMLASVAVWAGLAQGMGPATRDLLYWVSALVAMPAIAYAGMPFFRPAWAALRQGRTCMDVPISIGVVLVTGVSLAQTIAGAEHAYFDSAVSLLFFLLIGRVLDHRARGRARETAERLLTLRAGDVAVIQADGSLRRCAQSEVMPGARILVAPGERVGADGVVEAGTAEGGGLLDGSMITGEALPVRAGEGTQVFAGMTNLGAALRVRVTATGEATLLAECVRLIEAAESRRGRFVVLADRVARSYAPVVHACAALTLLWWWGVQGAPLAQSLLVACTVLIVTCPCALALAVPAVQVIATGALFRQGILLKSPTALERLAAVDTVVFDKTGTLTEPVLSLSDMPADPAALGIAASLAACSRHPLARALLAASGPVAPLDDVEELPGRGLRCGAIRLGSRDFAGDTGAPAAAGPELWLARPGHVPQRFGFGETLRADAPATIAALHAAGLRVLLASGDAAGAVDRAAEAVGIGERRAGCSPVDKVALVEGLRRQGRHVLMVGDGLNDGPSLAAAEVSMSPSHAADLTQTVADLVFQGRSLAPVAVVLRRARRAQAVMRQNIALSIAYNAVLVPLAMAGAVTPWLAAASMSGSSLVVMANSLRVRA